MMALDGGRIGIASQAIGIARGALEAAIRYAGERQTFGQPIIKHQAIGGMLADAATWLDAAHADDAARRVRSRSSGQPFSQLAAMAKLFATEHAWKICDIALQVHGGYGYVRDFPVERALRDVRVTRIYEGTSEIQRIVIARNCCVERQRQVQASAMADAQAPHPRRQARPRRPRPRREGRRARARRRRLRGRLHRPAPDARR